MNRRRIFSHILIALFLTGGFAVPAPAHAALFSLGDIAAAAIGQLTSAFAYLVGYVGGLILNLLGWIVNIMMELNRQVFDPQNTLVHVGWGIMRDVANLGFVLVILVIAIAMMLRVGRYGSQKLLIRLIAAAIIVNFSLAIAGAFVEFSNVFTQFFLNRIPSPAGIGSALMGAFNPQRFHDAANFSTTLEGLTTFGTEMFAFIAQTIFPVVFMLIAIITVGTFAIMLFLRYLHLTFLGIIAPIIWLFWVVPDLSGKFSEWWTSFIKWVFFAPAATFFIYLAFAALEGIGKLPALNAGGSNFFTAGLITIMSQGVQMFVISGIMLGGLIVAQQMGIAGASIGMNLANKAKAGALAVAGRAGRRVGAYALESKPMAAVGKFLQGQTGFRGLGMRLGGQAEIIRKGLVEDADKRLKKYGDAHLAKNLEALSQPEYVAATERLGKNGTVGLTGNIPGVITPKNKKLFEQYYGKEPRQWKAVELAAGMNVASADAIRNNDDTGLKQEMEKWMKGFKPEDFGKLPVNDFFNGKSTIDKLGPGATAQMSDALRTAVVSGVVQKVPANLAKLFKNVKDEGFDDLHSEVTRVRADIKSIDPARAQQILDVLAKIPAIRLYEGGAGSADRPEPPAPTPRPAPAAPTP